MASVLLQRSVLDSLLFALAIAVGITLQLLPAVVSVSLATGSRALTRHQVLVKRLVGIEDLGDMDILVTDKTGTPEQVLLLGLLSTETDYAMAPEQALGLNPLDAALWEAPGRRPCTPQRISGWT